MKGDLFKMEAYRIIYEDNSYKEILCKGKVKPTLLDLKRVIEPRNESGSLLCGIEETKYKKGLPLFLKEDVEKMSLPRRIAEYLMQLGARKSFSGNYHVEFEEINNKFGTCLPKNKNLLSEIENHLDPNIFTDMIIEEDFDMMYGTDFIDNYEDEDYLWERW